MNSVSSKIGTCTLDGKIKTVSVDQGWKTIALKLVSGTVTYMGTEPFTADDGTAVASVAEVLDDTGFEITAENPIDGFVIDASSGVVIVAFIK